MYGKPFGLSVSGILVLDVMASVLQSSSVWLWVLWMIVNSDGIMLYIL